MDKSKQIEANRRKALIGISGVIGAGCVLPEKWVKPVVNSVILPSHAQMSITTTSSPATTTIAPGPVVAVLNGVVDGIIGTTFTVDASASTGPVGAALSYMFNVDNNCILLSQSGATAVIERGLIAGTCTVSVTVTDRNTSDTATQMAQVTGGPPTTPVP